jgi:hypothetical protein
MQLGRRGIAVLDDAAGSDERQHEMDCHATLVAAQRRPAGARSAPVVDRRDPDFNEMILTHPALRLTYVRVQPAREIQDCDSNRARPSSAGA